MDLFIIVSLLIMVAWYICNITITFVMVTNDNDNWILASILVIPQIVLFIFACIYAYHHLSLKISLI